MRRLPALLALLAAAPASAGQGPRLAPPRAFGPLPRVGLALDAGVPGGAGVVLQARLIDALRVNAGPMWSGVGLGGKAGVVLAPLQAAVSPSLELEGGYAVRADLSFLAGRYGLPSELHPVLAHASYWYASALVGLDAGSPTGLSFFVRGGLARIEARAPRTVTTDAGGGTLQIGDTSLHATIPCLKLGLQFWF
jgi:hypothetical protein